MNFGCNVVTGSNGVITGAQGDIPMRQQGPTTIVILLFYRADTGCLHGCDDSYDSREAVDVVITDYGYH